VKQAWRNENIEASAKWRRINQFGGGVINAPWHNNGKWRQRRISIRRKWRRKNGAQRNNGINGVIMANNGGENGNGVSAAMKAASMAMRKSIMKIMAKWQYRNINNQYQQHQ
jgi:hypothetical protein